MHMCTIQTSTTYELQKKSDKKLITWFIKKLWSRNFSKYIIGNGKELLEKKIESDLLIWKIVCLILSDVNNLDQK